MLRQGEQSACEVRILCFDAAWLPGRHGAVPGSWTATALRWLPAARRLPPASHSRLLCRQGPLGEPRSSGGELGPAAPSPRTAAQPAPAPAVGAGRLPGPPGYAPSSGSPPFPRKARLWRRGARQGPVTIPGVTSAPAHAPRSAPHRPSCRPLAAPLRGLRHRAPATRGAAAGGQVRPRRWSPAVRACSAALAPAAVWR